jgi:DNA-binding MarR family transcriptional regulator
VAGKSNLEKRLFSTVSTRAAFLPPATLTALDWRVLIVTGMHDGMSLLREAQGKSKGPGCVAAYKTLARECQCTYSALLRTLKKLHALNLIEIAGGMRGEKVVIRVRYDVPDNVPQEMVKGDELVTSNDQPVTSHTPSSDRGGHSNQENCPDFCGSPVSDYSSSKGELDYVETSELNSLKVRDGISSKLNAAKAGLPMVSLRRHLPKNFDAMPSHAQVPCIDRIFRAIGADPELIITKERHEISSLLDSISEAFADEPTGQQAARLYGEIAIF